jgi:hypothetical protein
MIRRDLAYNTHLEYLDYSNYKMDWDSAWLYCATCTYKDMYDWRMLTPYEFRNDTYTAGMPLHGRITFQHLYYQFEIEAPL